MPEIDELMKEMREAAEEAANSMSPAIKGQQIFKDIGDHPSASAEPRSNC